MADLLQGVPLPGIDPTDVEAASTRVRNYCGWHIAPSVTETVTVSGRGRWMLRSRHVTAVSAIFYHGTVIPVASSFDWTEDGLVSLGSYRMPLTEVDIAIIHGYTVCPADVRDVVEVLATSSLATAQPTTFGFGPFRVGYDSADDPMAPLEPYRLPLVA